LEAGHFLIGLISVRDGEETGLNKFVAIEVAYRRHSSISLLKLSIIASLVEIKRKYFPLSFLASSAFYHRAPGPRTAYLGNNAYHYLDDQGQMLANNLK
jgi:hypothetical protein